MPVVFAPFRPEQSCAMVRAGAARREQRHAKRDLARATRGKQKYKNQKGDGIKKGVIRKTARPARDKHGQGRGRRFDPEAEEEEGEDDVRATCLERPAVFSKLLSHACPVSRVSTVPVPFYTAERSFLSYGSCKDPE